MIDQTVDSHSFYPDLLTPAGWVLDAGARGFSFSKHFIDRGFKVIALEPDTTCIPDIDSKDFHFYHEALYDCNQIMTYSCWSTGEGNMVHHPELYSDGRFDFQKKHQTQARDLIYLMNLHGIEIFELIKLDIEGSEYKFLEWYVKNAKVLTKQFSIEFHDFTGRNQAEEFSYETIDGGWFNDTYDKNVKAIQYSTQTDVIYSIKQ